MRWLLPGVETSFVGPKLVAGRGDQLGTGQGHNLHGTPYGISKKAWAVLKSTPALADTEHDGTPDAREKAIGLNPNNSADRSLRAKDGHTILESYSNGLGARSLSAQPRLSIQPPCRPFSGPEYRSLKFRFGRGSGPVSLGHSITHNPTLTR